jgi:sialic acid synthase SpsE
VSAYPAREIRLEKIQALRALFPKYVVGLSDHTLDYTCAPVEAFRHYGCKVLEKHFNPLNKEDTPDRVVSLNKEQFKIMVDRIKQPTKFDYYPEKEEQTALKCYNRRLVATKDIMKGDIIRWDDVGIYRTFRETPEAIGPFHRIPRVALRNYKPGEAIRP